MSISHVHRPPPPLPPVPSSSEEEIPPTLDSLPIELLGNIVRCLATDDYHMLTLPLVSQTFRKLYGGGSEVGAARMASRLRQVAAAVVETNLSVDGSDEWALAHAWGAVNELDLYLCPVTTGTIVPARLKSLETAPEGTASLRTLLAYCSKSKPPRTATVHDAQDLFFEAEAKRLQQPGGRSSMASFIHRETAGDRAAKKEAKELGFTREANARAALRREVEKQAQKQNEAECRRRWKQLTSKQRKEWERWALELQRQESQRLAIAKTTVDVAASLLAAIEDV